MAEQTYKVNFKVDTSELDIAQAKADKLLATMKEIEKVGEKITEPKAEKSYEDTAQKITKGISKSLQNQFPIHKEESQHKYADLESMTPKTPEKFRRAGRNTIKVISNRKVLLNGKELIINYLSMDSRKSSNRPEVTLKLDAVPFGANMND
ncbi:hypothetical protein [Ligilactobacillus equi]|uniref:Uncharacterized protein n=1 Tax=Ligilactobacillus equi DSM 15833 = JCM 10991 TaxID=1423740 RepID=A0A0R1TK74_9LACO|nr:hypothetical protein [Ligilactobacillus equi]KRL81775.1 hypothetical protein FC36_GL001367 [Ligilactobacillus equi DSM 15833 = JCM 10991]